MKKPYSQLVSQLQEHYASSDEEAPVFKKLDQKTKPDLETKSDRFGLRVHHNGDTGLITIHHKDTGEHIGTISFNRAGKTAARITEMAKSPESDHPKMMHEAITHLHEKHGYSFFSSTTMTTAGHKVWEQLAKTHKIALYDKNKEPKKRVISKDVTPSSKYQEKNPTKASKEYLLHKWNK
jgi:hypothetical protein